MVQVQFHGFEVRDQIIHDVSCLGPGCLVNFQVLCFKMQKLGWSRL